MTRPRKPPGASGGIANERESAHDRRTELVKEITAKENAALDAKTARLRAQRLAREAKEDAAAPGKAKPPKPRRMKRITAS